MEATSSRLFHLWALDLYEMWHNIQSDANDELMISRGTIAGHVGA